MTTEEIDALARRKENISAVAPIAEIGLYARLSAIYHDYDDKMINAAEARTRKEAAISEYQQLVGTGALLRQTEKQLKELRLRADLQSEIIVKDAQVRNKLGWLIAEANKSPCKICKNIANAWNGFDVATVNSRNINGEGDFSAICGKVG